MGRFKSCLLHFNRNQKNDKLLRTNVDVKIRYEPGMIGLFPIRFESSFCGRIWQEVTLKTCSDSVQTSSPGIKENTGYFPQFLKAFCIELHSSTLLRHDKENSALGRGDRLVLSGRVSQAALFTKAMRMVVSV